MFGLMKPDGAVTESAEFMINGTGTRRGNKRKVFIRLLFTANNAPISMTTEEVSVYNMRICDVIGTCMNLPGLVQAITMMHYPYLFEGHIYFDFQVELLQSPLSSLDIINFIRQTLHVTSIEESGYTPAPVLTQFKK